MSMLRNMRFYPLILVLAVSLTFAGGWTLKAEGSSLSDLGEASWAERAITEMEASGVVAGYPGNVYKPYNDVTKLESVAMLIRMLGLEDQAKAAEETGADYTMPPDLYWGSGYLIMAVERGMLAGDYLYLLEPNVPATRTEVAMLAFHALKLNPESEDLDFDDADEIPSEYREGVAAVVKSGIMQGLPGNVFEPNDNINRAQIAVMMSKIVELKYADPCADRRAKGNISGIDLDSRVVTVESIGSIFYTADCEFFLDGVSVLPDELKTGDEINIILDENGHAVYVNAHRTADAGRYKGIVRSLQVISGEYWLGITSDEGLEITRPVAQNVKLNVPGGNQLNLSALDKGDYVEILLTDNIITGINSLELEYSLKGVIRDLDFSGTLGITLRNDDGDTVDYEVSESVEVERNGDSIDFNDLIEGEQVRMELNSLERVNYIEVIEYERDQLKGVIRELDTVGAYGITIRTDSRQIMEYKVDGGVEVEDEDDDSIEFRDLDEGDRVRLELDGSNEVDYIKLIESDAELLEGEIWRLDVDGDYGITLRSDNGRITEYEVINDVEVEWDGDRIYFYNLKYGQQVRLELDSGDRVDYIEVVDDYLSIEGKVSDLMVDDSPFIRVQRSSGITVQYYLMKGTDYYRDDDSISMDDIVIGSEVKIRVYDDNVTRLDVTNDEDITITGTVVYVDESEEKIRIEQVSGNRFTYDLVHDPVLQDHDGWSIDLDDIEEGWEVRLNLENGKITGVRVLG